MANQTGTSPIILDSVMAAAYTSSVYVQDIMWSNMTAAGHQIIIVDRAGNTILDDISEAPNDTRRFAVKGWINGYQLTKIDSGKITFSV